VSAFVRKLIQSCYVYKGNEKDFEFITVKILQSNISEATLGRRMLHNIPHDLPFDYILWDPCILKSNIEQVKYYQGR
jgi:hypothetical protein